MARAEGHQSNAATILGLAVLAAATAAVSLVTVNRLKDAVVFASLHGQPLGASRLLAVLGPADAGLAAVSMAALLALLWIEFRQAAVSRLLATATAVESFVLLTIILAWLGHSYLNPGVLLGGDTGTHISRFLEVERGLQAGRLSQWTNYQYAGAPLLWFTGPLTYVVGGTLALVVNDAVLATKILLFSLHMIAGWLFFALLRRFDIRPVAAMLIAAGFAGSFAHLHLFLYRGVIPQAVTIVLLVLLFYAADGALRNRGPRWANFLIFALSTAAMIVNHQPHALFAAAYLAVFGTVSLLTGFWRWRGIPLLAAAGSLGVLASVVAVVPVLVEADWVMIEPEGSLFQFHLPTLARLINLVVWRNTRTTWGIDYWAYLGIGLLALGAAGVAGLSRGKLPPERRVIALGSCVCLLICLVMYNPVVRDVMFILFFLGLLAALGLDWLIDRGVLAPPRLLLLAAVMLADLASTAVQPVARTDKGFIVEAGRMLEQIAPDKRFIQVGLDAKGDYDADKGPDGGPISYYSTVQRVAGNHNMAATRVHNFLLAAANLVETDLRSAGALSPRTRTLLRLFNVGEVICSSSVANGCPAGVDGTSLNPVLGRYIPVDGAPALFSRRLVSLDLGPGLQKPMFWPDDFAPTSDRRRRVDAVDAALDRFLAAEQPDSSGNQAAAIPITGQVAPREAASAGTWHPVIEDYTVSLDRVRLQVETDGAGYAQLAHPWFPSTVVTINGQEVQPIRGTIDLIVVPLQPGVSVIELHDGTTAARSLSTWGSLLGLVAIGVFAALLAWHDRQQRAAPIPLGKTA